MQNRKANDSLIFKIDKNGTLIRIKKPGWKLQKLKIPEGVYSIINWDLLVKNNNLRLLTLPSTFKNFNMFFYYPLSLKSIINHSPVLFDWWVENHKYDGKTLSEMEEIDLNKYTNSDGKPFTILESKSFYRCNKNFKKINTGLFVTEIKDFAFMECQDLEYAEIGKNIQSIGMRIFYNCPKLKSENVISHSPTLFEWWVENHKYNGVTLKRMEKIDLSKYTNSDGKPFISIDGGSFFESRLQKFNTGPFVIKIEDCAFMNCYDLAHLEIGKNVQSIGSAIFGNRDFPENQLQSKNVINHSPVLFRWWVVNHKYNGKTLNELETIDLDKCTNSDGKLFTMISEYTFMFCDKVKNILFGESIKQIDKQYFNWCDKLKNIQITNKDILFAPEAFNGISKSINFYVRDKQIKEKLQKIGINSKQIFIKPIPKEELEEPKKTEIELTC